MEVRYMCDDSKVVNEVLDQEVVLVNLDTGFYYVLEGTGSDIWQRVAAGATVPEIAVGLSQRYAGERAEIEAAVRSFVTNLAQEALLTPLAGQVEAPAGPGEAPGPARQAWTLPVMYKYTDMANLIQMDPIREFDETGWPTRRASPPANQG